MALIPISSFGIESIRDLVQWMPPLASWKTLALVLALLNIKSLPFSWHIRLIYHLIRNMRLRPGAPLAPKVKAAQDSKGGQPHPLFVPSSITSRTPLMETDYNIHKSNSTYFSDLDISRTALVSRLYYPGMSIVSKELDKELNLKKRAPIYVALGSVYCSFKREIKPYELFEIQSKVAGWDQKWLYILSFFLRPERRKGEGKTLLATAISKYVVKKGRLTVPPERVLRASGFLPPRPEGAPEQSVSGSNDTSAIGTPAAGEETAVGEGVDGSAVREDLTLTEDKIPEPAVLRDQKRKNTDSWDPQEWSWERIDEERKRGLEIIEGYINLDAKLHEQWSA
ncbi:hypothetical protein M432DRAFT_604886 [Thermoascus aurantiacus ATCC 26904]